LPISASQWPRSGCLGVYAQARRQAAAHRAWLSARRVPEGRTGASRGMSARRQPGSRSEISASRSCRRTDVRYHCSRIDRQHGNWLAQRQAPRPMADDFAGRNGGQGRQRQKDALRLLRRHPRSKPVSKLTTEDALRVLDPLWQTRPETANRLRGRCERVWDFAKARGHCSGENPFRWRGHLDKLLPKRPRLTRG
jgi:integrase-like protein